MHASATGQEPIAGDVHIIEVHVAELRQLFNSMDPAPFHQRDLDTKAEQYIVSIGAAQPHDAKPALLVHIDREPPVAEATAILRDAVRQFFTAEAAEERRRL